MDSTTTQTPYPKILILKIRAATTQTPYPQILILKS